MSDQFTEVTNQSWFGRIKDTFFGAIFGVLLLGIAVAVLFWNEGRTVKREQALKEGAGVVVSVAADKIDAANEGKLVHLSGLADTQETLSDPEFNVSVKAIRLKRTVEMYQWQEQSKSETKKKLGGGTETVTTYTYSKAWRDSLVNSGSFKNPEGHQNPAVMQYQSTSANASAVTLGAFRLSPALISAITSFAALPKDALPAPSGNMRAMPDGYYIGADLNAPAIGDYKISYSVVMPTDVSVVAKQVKDTFEAYSAKSGDTIALLETGTHSAAEMFKTAQEENAMIKWALRVVGVIVMFIGCSMMVKPLSVLADVIPPLGSLVGFASGLAAFFVSATFSLMTISVAWIFYRPLLGIALLVGAVASFIVAFKLKRKPTA